MTWRPGVSGNPGGRPPKTEGQRAFEDACRGFLWEEGWQVIEKMARTDNFRERQWALEVMMERGFGRPIQSLDFVAEPNPYEGVSTEDLISRIKKLIGEEPNHDGKTPDVRP